MSLKKKWFVFCRAYAPSVTLVNTASAQRNHRNRYVKGALCLESDPLLILAALGTVKPGEMFVCPTISLKITSTNKPDQLQEPFITSPTHNVSIL
jgi:hypothetical protein